MEEKAERSAAGGVKSPLDKPLGELTEDDISQVTREDCRRFLKEKGMRRPSWNKSQAIQQVISLKALLETKQDNEDDDDAADDPGPSSFKRQKKYSDPSPSPPPPPQHPQQLQFISAAHDPLLRPAPSIPQLNDENTEESPIGVRDPPAIVEIAGVSPRVDSKPDAAVVGQMTVFYGGKVNVFDGVPSEKALLIMRIAASQDYYNGPSLDALVDLNRQFQLSQTNHFQAAVPPRPLPASLQVAHNAGGMPLIRFPTCVRDGAERKVSREFDHEGPGCRKASLQRYLEKRKDRRTFKCKRNMDGLYSASTDLYMNQKFKFQNSNALQCQRETNSPPHPNPPPTPTRSNSIENHTQNIRFSFDLNDEGYVRHLTDIDLRSYCQTGFTERMNDIL